MAKAAEGTVVLFETVQGAAVPAPGEKPSTQGPNPTGQLAPWSQFLSWNYDRRKFPLGPGWHSSPSSQIQLEGTRFITHGAGNQSCHPEQLKPDQLKIENSPKRLNCRLEPPLLGQATQGKLISYGRVSFPFSEMGPLLSHQCPLQPCCPDMEMSAPCPTCTVSKKRQSSPWALGLKVLVSPGPFPWSQPKRAIITVFITLHWPPKSAGIFCLREMAPFLSPAFHPQSSLFNPLEFENTVDTV